jgi:hypothetical protein
VNIFNRMEIVQILEKGEEYCRHNIGRKSCWVLE